MCMCCHNIVPDDDDMMMMMVLSVGYQLYIYIYENALITRPSVALLLWDTSLIMLLVVWTYMHLQHYVNVSNDANWHDTVVT